MTWSTGDRARRSLHLPHDIAEEAHPNADPAVVYPVLEAAIHGERPPLVLVACWLRWRPEWQRAAALAGLAALLALGIGQLVGMAFPRARPYAVTTATALVPHAPDTSFPSDHATLALSIWRALPHGRPQRRGPWHPAPHEDCCARDRLRAGQHGERRRTVMHFVKKLTEPCVIAAAGIVGLAIRG